MTTTLAARISNAFATAADPYAFFGDKGMSAIRMLEEREKIGLKPFRDSCTTNLFFGFFFDGTKNNYIDAEDAKNHSNIARLYDCFPGLSVPGVLPRSTDWGRDREKYENFFRVYVPGVSSRFVQVGDTGKGSDLTLGAAGGALGERRIIWALVQAINNLHRYFYKTALVNDTEAYDLVRTVKLNSRVRSRMVGVERRGRSERGSRIARERFAAILGRLHEAMKPHWLNVKTGKPTMIDPCIVKTIYISIFGFSRGATQARAFTNWLQSLCRLDAQLVGAHGRMSLGGFPVVFDFLGLYDTVASVGFASTLGTADGHGAWADAEDSLRVPAGIKCVHLVAAHEIRRSFPVDSISVNGVIPKGCEEIVLPGVHSDVGCGYCPREQGRGTDPSGDDMLARIPLLIMYRKARLAGVPLKLELTPEPVQRKFALTTATIKAFNAYIAECKQTNGPLHLIMREQARKYIEWRIARRSSGNAPMHLSASFGRASTFDQNDLHSAMLEFETEIQQFEEWFSNQGKGFVPVSQQAGFDDEHMAEWEEIATWWKSKAPPSAAVMDLFDNYVHDSRAWFKVDPRGIDNEPEMHATLAKWVKQRRFARERNEARARVIDRGSGLIQAKVEDGLSDAQRKAADEYAQTGKIPRMITTGREPFTWAGAGYLRYRKVYAGSDDHLISGVPANDEPVMMDSLLDSQKQARA